MSLSLYSSTRSLRCRIWDLRYGERAALTNFHPRRCWQRLPPSFDWRLAFSRLSRRRRPPLNRIHTDTVFKVLHGLLMANRPVGRWGRPCCSNCGSTIVDTNHAFFCPTHVAAMIWFWETAQSLASTETLERSVGTLLGGLVPCLSLSGFVGRAYVWEVLRVSFLSVLYRIWMRATISVQHEGGHGVFYESRHIILSTIAAIRLTIRLDARRTLTGVRHVQRDGQLVESNRFLNFFNGSWISSGWASFTHLPRIGIDFPVQLDLSGLRPLHIPSPTSEDFHGFTY
jgi:hypothetical protein